MWEYLMQATHLAGAVIALKGLGGILFVLNSNIGALLLVSITFFWIYDHFFLWLHLFQSYWSLYIPENKLMFFFLGVDYTIGIYHSPHLWFLQLQSGHSQIWCSPEWFLAGLSHKCVLLDVFFIACFCSILPCRWKLIFCACNFSFCSKQHFLVHCFSS